MLRRLTYNRVLQAVAQRGCTYKIETESRKNFLRVAPSSIFGTHLCEKKRPVGQFACLSPAKERDEFAKLSAIRANRG
ncbi:MAG: hypothetical protein A4E65_02131 [Syntrophorhabdus sp. PtaU1.Bin153]|nr:MAG: hypothetical protein A4E65_02131 [Syntrophorhabdus sp. PtaU1.Bin153]